jgi:hypothetical protein
MPQTTPEPVPGLLAPSEAPEASLSQKIDPPAKRPPLAAGTENAAPEPTGDEDAEKALMAGSAAQRIAALEQELSQLRGRQQVLGDELAKSKTDLAALQEENDRLKLQVQALGLEALTGDQRALQLRLLSALNDYRLADAARRALSEQLVKLSDAVTAYQQTSDASSRRLLEESLDQAAAVLKGSAPAEETEPTPLEQARVVSYKQDLGLAVINAGKTAGLRLGMPISITRKENQIAKGVIVDCRNRITGILITEETDTELKVALGDGVKLEANQNNK